MNRLPSRYKRVFAAGVWPLILLKGFSGAKQATLCVKNGSETHSGSLGDVGPPSALKAEMVRVVGPRTSEPSSCASAAAAAAPEEDQPERPMCDADAEGEEEENRAEDACVEDVE